MGCHRDHTGIHGGPWSDHGNPRALTRGHHQSHMSIRGWLRAPMARDPWVPVSWPMRTREYLWIMSNYVKTPQWRAVGIVPHFTTWPFSSLLEPIPFAWCPAISVSWLCLRVVLPASSFWLPRSSPKATLPHRAFPANVFGAGLRNSINGADKQQRPRSKIEVTTGTCTQQRSWKWAPSIHSTRGTGFTSSNRQVLPSVHKYVLNISCIRTLPRMSRRCYTICQQSRGAWSSISRAYVKSCSPQEYQDYLVVEATRTITETYLRLFVLSL